MLQLPELILHEQHYYEVVLAGDISLALGELLPEGQVQVVNLDELLDALLLEDVVVSDDDAVQDKQEADLLELVGSARGGPLLPVQHGQAEGDGPEGLRGLGEDQCDQLGRAVVGYGQEHEQEQVDFLLAGLAGDQVLALELVVVQVF